MVLFFCSLCDRISIYSPLTISVASPDTVGSHALPSRRSEVLIESISKIGLFEESEKKLGRATVSRSISPCCFSCQAKGNLNVSVERVYA